MAGLNKEDLDEGARQTLMAHNVDVENMDMEWVIHIYFNTTVRELK